MAGYIRQDVSNNIADGNIINASDFDNEYNAIEAAFHASTGHTHDGTAAEGAPITKIGPTQDVVASATTLLPKTDNTIDLGSSTLEYKDLWIDGTANIDSLVADTADINAGTIDGVTIGGASAGAGTFTTLTASSTTTLSALTASTALALNASKEVVSVTNTGTGNNVLATSPTLTTPNLGTPSAVTLTNATGLPVSTGISGLGTGMASFLATPSSANLASTVTDETGSGALVFANSPSLTTPNLGTPSAATLTNATGLPVSTGISGLGTGVATFLATPSSANLAAAVTGETGSGALVFATSPALTTPNLGTPSAVTLTNATGLPVSTGISGLGANVATFLATPSSANLASAVTDETGSGALVFATSPTLTTPNLGTPSAVTLTNATGLPLTTGVTGVLAAANGGTGVNNSTRTLTINGNAGTLNFGAASKTLTINNSLTLSGTDATTMTFPTTSATIARTDAGQTFTGTNVFTSPRIVTGINDTNGNELFLFTATASAVNEVTLANAATGNAPTFTSSGSDSNIDLVFSAKGTGQVKETVSGANYALASAYDVGTAPNEIPLNQYLGSMAFTTATNYNTNASPNVISVNSSSTALRITQTGSGDALVVEDASPDSSPFVVDTSGRVAIGGTTVAGTSLRIPGVSTSAVTSNSISIENTIQSDVTSSWRGILIRPTTQAASFTLSSLYGVYVNPQTFGAGSVVTNQYAFFAESTLTGATNNFGFYSNIASGTGRFNFYANGTADNYFAGRIGVGVVPSTGFNIVNRLAITGATTAHGYWTDSTVSSDVTSSANYYSSFAQTAAASFTLAGLNHFSASQGTFGAGSSVTNQYGFIANSTLTGATNNYGFLSNIAAGTGRWNFYANGTARNLFNGNTGIGGDSGATIRLFAGGSATGSTAQIGIRSNETIQSDVTTSYQGVDSLLSTQAAAFTLTSYNAYRAGLAALGATSAVSTVTGFSALANLAVGTNNYAFRGQFASAANTFNLYMDGTAANHFSGNVLIFGAGGLGYTTGSGGAVTQTTSRTQGVTLDKTNGAITLVSAAGTTTWQSFTVTNNTVAATDVVKVCQKSGTDLYMIHVTAVAAGSFRITFATTGGTTTEQPVFNFAVIKASAS